MQAFDFYETTGRCLPAHREGRQGGHLRQQRPLRGSHARHHPSVHGRLTSTSCAPLRGGRTTRHSGTSTSRGSWMPTWTRHSTGTASAGRSWTTPHRASSSSSAASELAGYLKLNEAAAQSDLHDPVVPGDRAHLRDARAPGQGTGARAHGLRRRPGPREGQVVRLAGRLAEEHGRHRLL